MKSVLISIQPKWVDKIKSGEKTIEVRKTKPKLETPFKCYIYETIERVKEVVEEYNSDHKCVYRKKTIKQFGGKVIGEFTCDNIRTFRSEFWDDETYEKIQEKYEPYDFCDYGEYEYDLIAEDGEDNELCRQACLTWEELRNYIGQDIREFFGWHISNLKIYDNPKELSEFYGGKVCGFKRWGNENEIGCWEGKCKSYDEGDCKNGYSRLTRAPQSWCYIERC